MYYEPLLTVFLMLSSIFIYIIPNLYTDSIMWAYVNILMSNKKGLERLDKLPKANTQKKAETRCTLRSERTSAIC